MNELRKSISTAREAYQSLRCPVDLTGCIEPARPAIGTARWSVRLAIAAVLAMALWVGQSPRASAPKSVAAVPEMARTPDLLPVLAVMRGLGLGISTLPGAQPCLERIPTHVKSILDSLKQKVMPLLPVDQHNVGLVEDQSAQA